jgi:hypothetical protein
MGAYSEINPSVSSGLIQLHNIKFLDLTMTKTYKNTSHLINYYQAKLIMMHTKSIFYKTIDESQVQSKLSQQIISLSSGLALYLYTFLSDLSKLYQPTITRNA